MITLPTRLTDHSSTLIDNIFSNFNKPHSHSSGVFVSNISDHFPYFYTLPSNSDYANTLNTNIDYSRKYTPHNLNKLYQDLESINIYGLMHSDIKTDPNINYNIWKAFG